MSVKYIETDLGHYYECVFQNVHNMKMAVEEIVQLKEEVTLDLQGPQRDTIAAINDALPILKAQTEVWSAHGRRLQQFISEELRANHSKIQWEVGSTKKSNDIKIVSVLRIMKTIAEICDETANSRSRVIRYLDQIISEKAQTEQTVIFVFEELQGAPIMDSHSSALWKQITRARILWRMYLQEYVLLEVRKQKEILQICRIARRFMHNISEENSNFYECIFESGNQYPIESTSVGRYAQLANHYAYKGLLKRNNALAFPYTADLVVDYMRTHDLVDAWEVSSELFLEELEDCYDEDNLWVIADDLCKMAYALTSIETSHLICSNLSEVFAERCGFFGVYGYSKMAGVILDCANMLYTYLCEHEGVRQVSFEDKAEAAKRDELDKIFSGGRKLLEDYSSEKNTANKISPIVYGYQRILTSDPNDDLADRKRSAMYYALHNTSRNYHDLIRQQEALDPTGQDNPPREDWEKELYYSHIIRGDAPLLYFEPNAGRSWGDLATIGEVLYIICEKVHGKSFQETDLTKRKELNDIYRRMNEALSELSCFSEKVGSAIFFAEEKLTVNSDRPDPLSVLQFIHPAYPYSREGLSWRYGKKLAPLAIQNIHLQNGLEGAAYTISSGSQYGFYSELHNSHHKQIGFKSASCSY